MTLFEKNRLIFKKRLKKLLDKKGVTQKEFADAISVSQPIVSMWLSGEKLPYYNNVLKIVEYFNIELSYLMGEDYLSFDKDFNYPNVEIIEEKNTIYHNNPNIEKIPVLGIIAAGIPMYATENILDYEEIDKSKLGHGEYFCLKIKGNSMSPTIQENDVVVVRKQSTVDNNQIAIVLVDNENATCKKIAFTESGITLIPINSCYDVVSYTNDDIDNLPITILGRVVESRRTF